ncbi:hypothetical protein TIFTF001_036471 [Ficus carica]|uniref:Uncharacterized protein n=1 Tax=Ficus carica TaxID=3494 RepID=A0AA88JAS7_FICCA|nr:hypothetical protein TIFTF001_036471 [Ficus carica]
MSVPVSAAARILNPVSAATRMSDRVAFSGALTRSRRGMEELYRFDTYPYLFTDAIVVIIASMESENKLCLNFRIMESTDLNELANNEAWISSSKVVVKPDMFGKRGRAVWLF